MRRSRMEMYRRKAEACRHQAALPQNASQKDRWLKLADDWSRLADTAKKDRSRTARTKKREVSSPVHIQAVR
jgi:hypothetical protein